MMSFSLEEDHPCIYRRGAVPAYTSQHARDYALPLLLRRRFTVPSRRSKLRSKCCLTSVCSRSSGACLLQGERGARALASPSTGLAF
uniref:Uncharacterized protein n=1 Tax=Brassica oleracea TaxID=3712 RepID=A0A3P6E541_BRAOL|nr:unnamed protein product [Brassica oleracea]